MFGERLRVCFTENPPILSDGTKLNVSISIGVTAYCPEPGQFAVICDDITAARRNEESLRQAATVSEQTRDGVAITDADGTYPVASIPALLAYAEQADMVVGARTGASVRIPLVSFRTGCPPPDFSCARWSP